MDDRRRQFDLIYAAHKDLCWAWLRGMLPAEEAEEAFQETWLILWRRLEEIEVRSPRAYVLQVARSQVSNRTRRPRLERVSEDPDSLRALTPHDRDDLSDRVAVALARLAPERREVLLLRHHGGLSYAQIGQVLGLKDGTVASRLHLAAADLRRALTAVAIEETT